MPVSAPNAPILCSRAAQFWKRSGVRFRARACSVADRGLREGMLVQMMRADGVWREEGAHFVKASRSGSAASAS